MPLEPTEATKDIKLFSAKQMQVAAFFGGPVPMGILFYKNFIRLGKDLAAYVSLGVALIVVAVLLVISFSPDSIISKLPRLVLPIFWSLSTFLIYRQFLTKDVAAAAQNGAEKGSNWSVVGYTLLGLAITVFMVLGLSFFANEFEGPYSNYKSNRLYHDNSLHIDELDNTAQQLYDIGYFDDQGYDARIVQTEDSYEITLLYLASNWQDEEFIDYFRDQCLFFEGHLKKDVVIILRDYNLAGDMITKRITN